MVEVMQKTGGATLLPSILDDDLSETTRGTGNVLSLELRANFDALRSLQPCEERPRKRSNTGQNLISSEANSEKAHSLAVSTYCMIEDEISRMKNGIAELEALLLATEDEETEHQLTNDMDNGTVVSDSEC